MSRGAAGVFVTGTGTGVGKTVVACALIRALRARGIDVGAMKPVETGVGADGPQDAQALRAATGEADPLADVCPYAFALPAAPSVAAAREGRSIDVTRLVAGFDVDTIGDLASLRAARATRADLFCPRTLAFLDDHELWRHVPGGS